MSATSTDPADLASDGRGPDDDAADDVLDAGDRAVPRWWRTLATVLAVVVVVGAGAGLWAVRTATYAPSEGSAEVGFSRDMTAHHQQAIVMSFQVRDLTDDPDVQALTLDLVTGQAEEMGMLTAWLRRHDVPASSSVPSMEWMSTPVAGEEVDHSTMGAGGEPMTLQDMGMATDDQLAELGSLTGVPAEVVFLQLMRAHHVGGTEMIDAYLARGTDDELLSIAEGMRTAQTREIRIIDELLAERGA